MKRYVHIALFMIILLLLLPGCSMVITGSEVSTVEPGAPGQPVETLATPQATATETSAPETQPTPASEELRPIAVEHVQILSGYASPIPALVSVSGTWPDLCAQLAQVSQPVIRDFQIEMTLLATPADPTCPPDNVGLPFYMEIPISWMELAEGAYTVTVNGQQTTLHVPVIPPPADPETGAPVLGVPLTPTPGAAPEGEAPAGGPEAQGEPVAVPVQDVQVQVGVGSPIPVEVAIAAGWPSLCAQLAEISQKADGFQIDITILAHPGRSDCPPDNVGYGFGLNVPISALELPEGSYTVTVNGISTTFDVPVTPSAVEPETGGEQPEGGAVALCPDVARPAVALFVPGENYLITNPLAGGECYTTLDGDAPGNFQATAEGVYYTVLEGEQFVVKRLGYDGSTSLLDFTAVDRDDALLYHSFAVSADGGRIAWAAATSGGDSGMTANSDMWVASIDGSDTVAPLPEYESSSGQQRVLVPVGFSQDNARLYYRVQPVGIGGSWASFVGRYDNLYMLQLNTDASPNLIFDCAQDDLFLCIGDFYEVEGQVSTLAYVDGTSVVILNGAGDTLNTLKVEDADYVGYPTFGPGGELVFYSADLSDEDILPVMGRIHRVAPPTAPAEVLVSDRGLLLPQGWLDVSHVVVGYNSGGGNWGTALVGLDGSLQVLQSEPNASFVDVLPAPAQ